MNVITCFNIKMDEDSDAKEINKNLTKTIDCDFSQFHYYGINLW